MKRLLLALTLVAAPAAAQSPAEKPAAPEQAKPRPALNLRLDNPSSYATTSDPEKEAAKGPKGLPTLGGDARPIAPPKREGTGASPGGPFPKDTNPNL